MSFTHQPGARGGFSLAAELGGRERRVWSWAGVFDPSWGKPGAWFLARDNFVQWLFFFFLLCSYFPCFLPLVCSEPLTGGSKEE